MISNLGSYIITSNLRFSNYQPEMGVSWKLEFVIHNLGTLIGKEESINKNISIQFFDYTITFVNPQH